MKVCFSLELGFLPTCVCVCVCTLRFCAADYADRHAEWYVQDLHCYFLIYVRI